MIVPRLTHAIRSALALTAAPRLLSEPLFTFQQVPRYASILADLHDVPGAYNKRIRRGRGPSSGKGKTSGRGHKGQKQHGKVPAGMNGGQTPDIVVQGVRGFKNHFAVEMSPLNLGRLQSWIDQGRIDPMKPITFRELVKSRCLHGIKDGVKLLAGGKDDFKTPVEITVSRASSEAIKAIEIAGGKITTRFFNEAGIKAVVRSGLSGGQPRLADASSRNDVEYYRDPARRGYLAETLRDGESPSLFFKTPKQAGERRKKSKGKQDKAANRLF